MLNKQEIIKLLQKAGLRPTRQRVLVGRLLFGPNHTHVSAESLYLTIQKQGQKMALATVYNCLNQFHKVGLLKKVHVVRDVIIFDTNLSYHHHFLNVDTGELMDIDDSTISIAGLPKLPDGFETESMELTIRVKPQR